MFCRQRIFSVRPIFFTPFLLIGCTHTIHRLIRPFFPRLACLKAGYEPSSPTYLSSPKMSKKHNNRLAKRENPENHSLTRRRFLASTTAGVATASMLPSGFGQARL